MNKLPFILSIFLFTSCFSMIACENATEADEKEAAIDTVKPESTVVNDPAVTATLLKQFDDLEKVFDNQNWMSVKGKDTSYLYVSRLNKKLALSHSFKMSKGDSSNLVVDTILLNDQQKISWNWKGRHLLLASATEFTNNWVGDSSTISFKKIDVSSLVSESKTEKIVWKKTMPLSTFLVRSYYDYQHGTKLAFEEKEFSRK